MLDGDLIMASSGGGPNSGLKHTCGGAGESANE